MDSGLFRCGNLDDGIAAFIIFQLQRAADYRVHIVHAGDVCQFQDFLVRQERFELRKNAVRHSSPGARKGIGIGKDSPFSFVEGLGYLPVGALPNYNLPMQTEFLFRKTRGPKQPGGPLQITPPEGR